MLRGALTGLTQWLYNQHGLYLVVFLTLKPISAQDLAGVHGRKAKPANVQAQIAHHATSKSGAATHKAMLTEAMVHGQQAYVTVGAGKYARQAALSEAKAAAAQTASQVLSVYSYIDCILTAD